MDKNAIQQCSKCGQKLRFPPNIGGMLMACPNCGQKFRSDFRLGDCNKKPFITTCEQYGIGFLPRLKQILISLFSCWFKTK
jgi:predicted RNA-binding Zn-ribbon protein involved in translation (DUF1610 family)